MCCTCAGGGPSSSDIQLLPSQSLRVQGPDVAEAVRRGAAAKHDHPAVPHAGGRVRGTRRRLRIILVQLHLLPGQVAQVQDGQVGVRLPLRVLSAKHEQPLPH